MTLGWHIGAVSGLRYLFKEGGGGGFHSLMRLYPAERIGTVLMTNATSINVRSVMDVIDKEAFTTVGAEGHYEWR
jgi:hypothetical protein